MLKIEQVVPWGGLVALIEPHYQKDGKRDPEMHREENVVCADAAYTGVEKRTVQN